MPVKLTLSVDKTLIKSIKEYSVKKKKSVSKIVSEYFKYILSKQPREKEELTPTVAALKGILKGKQVTEQDYKKYLEDKYLEK
ncbi:hypothetical protein JCM13304A_05340 [Desulfothermus okinawensis JCM 13304]